MSGAVTDSMSQPDFSMGQHQEVQSASGHGTAAATDSVRPQSQPGFKIQPQKGTNMKLQKSMRPTTVGGPTPGSKLFRRSDYVRLMRSTAN